MFGHLSCVGELLNYRERKNEVPMWKRLFSSLLIVYCSFLSCPRVVIAQFGVLPSGAVSVSRMGPADEILLYLMFDPAIAQDLLPEGLRFLTLEEFANRGDSSMADYLRSHPEHKDWARSYFEIIRTPNLEYDGYKAQLKRRGGMAIWYANVVRTDLSDIRPKGWQSLALGTWVSDKKLVEHMRTKGYPVEYARIEYWQDGSGTIRGKLKTNDLRVGGQCKLAGSPKPADLGEPPTFQTVWTPGTVARTFEVVTFYGHLRQDCSAADWQIDGEHRLAKAFRKRAMGGLEISGTEYYSNYVLSGGLYRR